MSLLARGTPVCASPQLAKRIRLANVLGYVLTAIAVIYTAVYFVLGKTVMTAITFGLAVLWAASIALIASGRHWIGRLGISLVGLGGGLSLRIGV